MDRTGPAELVPAAIAGYEADQVQDFSQGDPGPDFGVGDARHDGSRVAEAAGRRGRCQGRTRGNREEEPVISSFNDLIIPTANCLHKYNNMSRLSPTANSPTDRNPLIRITAVRAPG